LNERKKGKMNQIQYTRRRAEEKHVNMKGKTTVIEVRLIRRSTVK
jgi:hypothetical protein